ncbi:MAG: hypothetical protein QOJ67_2119 [Acidimicrobiaceae bacterium]|jgi:hypothetical protein
MTEVREEGELGSSVDEVWKLVGDFGGLLEAMGMPVDLDGEGIGQTRTIQTGAEPMVERLEERDEAATRCVYSIVSGPFPVRGYRSTMQLSAVGDGRTKLVWSSTFEPAEGTTAEDAAQMVRGVYQGGIAGLQARFGA